MLFLFISIEGPLQVQRKNRFWGSGQALENSGQIFTKSTSSKIFNHKLTSKARNFAFVTSEYVQFMLDLVSIQNSKSFGPQLAKFHAKWPAINENNAVNTTNIGLLFETRKL